MTKWQLMMVACIGLLLHALAVVKVTMRSSVFNELIWGKKNAKSKLYKRVKVICSVVKE